VVSDKMMNEENLGNQEIFLMVFNATFNNISVISWWSVLLVKETEDPDKIIDLLQVIDKLYHIMFYT
jgi:hypothetical protein